MSTALRTLIIEDQTSDVELMVYQLRRAEFDVIYQQVQTEGEYRAALEAIQAGMSVDIILADYNLPQFNAIQALKLLQTYHLYIPLIVVTGMIGEEAAASCIRHGAVDYLLKDRLGRLGTAVTRALQQKQLQEEKKQSERRFRALIENSLDGIALIGVDGVIQYVGPSAYRILGYNSEKLPGSVAFEHIHPDDLPEVMGVFRKILFTPNQVYPVQFRFRHKKGSWVWLDVVGNNLLAEPGIYAIVVNFRDITERKEIEEAMRQAQKLESLGVMAGGVAHDFNNLLTAILAQNSLALVKMAQDAPARVHIEKAVNATQRAADLTRQLLAYSGRGQFEIRPIHFNHLIEENWSLFQMTLPQHTVLRHELSEPLPLIDGDVGQMQQVIMNLVLNAAEAMTEQPNEVLVRTGTRTITAGEDYLLAPYAGDSLMPGRYVTLEVEDKGCGMDEKTLSRIFDPFFTTKFAGRGLGLASVLGIIRGHKGGMMVKSRVGKGTTFTLLFPVSQEETVEVETETAVSLSPPSSLLIIDDEEAVRHALADILTEEGIEVLLAADGATGVAIYEQHPQIQLIILDLSMPGLSGEETLRQLQTINPNAPIVLSSGYHQWEIGRRIPGLKVKGFLQKPYNIAALLNEIRQHLY